MKRRELYPEDYVVIALAVIFVIMTGLLCWCHVAWGFPPLAFVVPIATLLVVLAGGLTFFVYHERNKKQPPSSYWDW